MKKIFIAVFVVGILFAVYLRRQIKIAIEKLDYGIASGIKLSGITFGESKITIPIWINNPTNFNVMVSKMNLDLFVNKVYAGTATLQSAYLIQKNGKSIIPFTVTLNNINAMQILINVNQFLGQSNWRDKVNISLRGETRAEVGLIYIEKVPISMDGSYKYWMG